MSDGTRSTESIVRALEEQANEMASEFLTAVRTRVKLDRVECMEQLIEDVAERMDELEGHTFEWLGIEKVESDGAFELRQGRRVMEVRARSDMSIVVDNRIMEPNPDLPVLDSEFYDAIMERVLDWARAGSGGDRRRHG